MGQDKALLPWKETTLLDHALARLRAVCAEVRILCGADRRYGDHGAPVDVDSIPGAGPLGGLLTGLERLQDSLGLFLAVDVPGVPVAVLHRLVALAPGHDLVVPVTARGPEPLCALYRSTCLEPVRRRLAAGQLKMTGFWPDVRVREVTPAELEALGDATVMFRNVNTPADYGDLRHGR
jgi:molybdopterin-guanine dinucleotide biosynthesis protein A